MQMACCLPHLTLPRRYTLDHPTWYNHAPLLGNAAVAMVHANSSLQAFCIAQECYRQVDSFLAGHNLVLQAEEHNSEAIINAVMASTAQHPIWLELVNLMMERSSSSDNVLYATGARHTHVQLLHFAGPAVLIAQESCAKL